MNGFWRFLASAGIWPSRLATLEVRGRRSGKTVRLPVVIADYESQRYLVAMLGEHTSWVANVRAAGGFAVLRHGKAEAVHLQELAVDQRAPVLRRYLRVAPGGRPHIPAGSNASLAELSSLAAGYPVFRIEPAVDHTTGQQRAPDVSAPG
jgi:deazaflavin-dependent oxidoreductase (nitroreductase family)